VKLPFPIFRFAFLLPVLAACATTQPLPDQRPGAAPALHTEEAGLWLQMDRIEENYASSSLRLKAPALEGYVREVVCRLSSDYCPT
jgi:hypothetical protein